MRKSPEVCPGSVVFRNTGRRSISSGSIYSTRPFGGKARGYISKLHSDKNTGDASSWVGMAVPLGSDAGGTRRPPESCSDLASGLRAHVRLSLKPHGPLRFWYARFPVHMFQ